MFVCICRVVPSSLKLPLSEASEAPCRSTNIRRTEAEIDRAKYSGSDRENLTERRKLNKQNSRNVNKNRMREGESGGTTNIHTHTQDEINIGENVELKTLLQKKKNLL